MQDDVDILISGAGASGLALACDLQRRGVSHRIIEASPQGFTGSRAKGIQPRTMEVFDDLGVLPLLEPRSAFYPPLGIHIGPLSLRRTMIKRHRPTGDVPHADTLLVPQSSTDLSLRERLEQLGGSVSYATRLTSFEQDAAGVTATVDGPEGQHDVRARFLVGADGGSSTVRRGAGIAFQGTTDAADRMIIADVRITGLSEDRWHIWPMKTGRFMAFCPLPGGSFQLMLRLRASDPATLDDDALRVLIDGAAARAGATLDEIDWSSVWRPNIRLAERYRSGNVLLVGDAAHVHPPTGAQGLNTGVQDAYNLGWKLAQVIAGAPPLLLDSYESERQPVAARVLGLATSLYSHLKDRPLAAAARGDEERQLTLTYRGGPLAPLAAASYRGIAAGDRSPDSPYLDSDGRRGTLFDFFRGPHFTLVAIGGRAAEAALRLSWPTRGARLERLVLADDNPVFRGFYGVDDDALVLVRPDGYVAAIARNQLELEFDLELSPQLSLMLPGQPG